MAFSVCSNTESEIRLATLDPGHFHAALVQKSMYEGVANTVHVYAPDTPDLDLHLSRIESYNSREENPTNWNTEVYKGPDFFGKLIEDNQSDLVVLAGNNRLKTEYIEQLISSGMNVLADKPMVINSEDFELLKQAFHKADENNLLLYDIMTERYEITTILQKELAWMPEIFGELEKGSEENPAITKESVHHFYKYVSGSVLIRPAWFFDVEQEGEGIVDVTTHLVDLVQWECFPGQIIDYESDIEVYHARRWPTKMTLEEFSAVTKQNEFPEYLYKDIEDNILNVYSNGEMNYKIKGVHAKVSVTWAYKAPEGTGDTHFSIMRGTKANLVIRQGEEENFTPVLYIEPINTNTDYLGRIESSFKRIQNKYQGVELEEISKGWKVIVPNEYRIGHEAHFAQVTEKYLRFLKSGKIPDWEVPNMLAKYYTTTKALELARNSNPSNN